MRKRFILLALLVFAFQEISSRTCYRQITHYYRYTYCDRHTWWWCSSHRTVIRTRYERRSYCCPGWKGNYCTEPICSPKCLHGTCISPGVCKCAQPFTGSACQQVTCSHLVPCFPGHCVFPDTCTCQSGFTGSGGTYLCSELTTSQKPDIVQCTAFIANIERLKKRELYRYMADSSDPNSMETDIRWLNQKDYNYVSVQFQAVYNPPEISVKPRYIGETSLGITGGEVELLLTKVNRGSSSTPHLSLRNTTQCKSNPGSRHPETGVFTCNITQTEYDRVLEHGDNLTITVTARNGGFREIVKTINYFTGQSMKKAMMFRFDFYKPYNCIQNKSCHGQPVSVLEDITRVPIKIRWNGWNDGLSGVFRYVWEIYRLVPNKYTSNLTENNPYNPEFRQETFASNSTVPTYTPKQPGMYSVVLEVEDRANNTEYARTLVLYDPSSEITINNDTSSRMYVSSAANETHGKWQANLDLPIEVRWNGHFENKVHEKEKLLNPVNPFPKLDYLHIITKYVDPELDDKYGKRTLQGIKNVHGITKFSYAFRHSHLGHVEPTSWTAVDDVTSEKQIFNATRTNGDGIIIWVKAIDTVGNSKTDSTIVYFDSTPPVIETASGNSPHLLRNVKNSTYSFGSRVTLTASDDESGIHQISWRILTNDTKTVLKEGNQPGNYTDEKPSVRDGKCNVQNVCFFYTHTIYINNCWFVVPREKLKSQKLILELTAYNMAMLDYVTEITVTDLLSFDGIDEYTGPMHLRVIKTLDNGVKLKWDIAPSCYERSGIKVVYKYGSGVSKVMFIDKNADSYDLVGLEPETNYTVEFVTEYGEQRSLPVRVSFVTKERPGISTGFIVGITIVFLILVGIILIGIFMWRTGRLSRTKERIQRRVSMYWTTRNNRRSAFNNAAYQPGDEEIYTYGNMEFDKTNDWIIPHSHIVLEEKLTSGRFADIFKARYMCKQNDKKIVIAKILRSDYTEEDLLLMKAKVNFHAKEVGDHKNVLGFVGAVNDNEAFGVYILLEYCEKGALRDWLLQQKSIVTEETIERLYRMALDIAKGMEHLASKKIVHRRLAARNILLTSQLEVKVAGFGPMQVQKENKDENQGKFILLDDSVISAPRWEVFIQTFKTLQAVFTKTNKDRATVFEHEKIPKKWMAPECMVSTKDATTKSDVWSYGIVMWEIFSLGETPYPGINSRDLPEKVKSGYRMTKPEYASDLHSSLMLKCWQLKPKHRPSFSLIAEEFRKSFHTGASDEFYY